MNNYIQCLSADHISPKKLQIEILVVINRKRTELAEQDDVMRFERKGTGSAVCLRVQVESPGSRVSSSLSPVTSALTSLQSAVLFLSCSHTILYLLLGYPQHCGIPLELIFRDIFT